VCIDRDGRSAADLYMPGDPPCEREVFPCRFPFLSLLILKVLHGAAAGRLDVDPFSPICLDSRFFNDKRKTWRASRGIVETRNETALGFSREKSASRYRASGPRDAHRRGEIALKCRLRPAADACHGVQYHACTRPLSLGVAPAESDCRGSTMSPRTLTHAHEVHDACRQTSARPHDHIRMHTHVHFSRHDPRSNPLSILACRPKNGKNWK